MPEKTKAATIIATLMLLSCLVTGQQLNPFTAVLTQPIARVPVKVGRKRILIKETDLEHQKPSKQSNTAASNRKNIARNHTPTTTTKAEQNRSDNNHMTTAEPITSANPSAALQPDDTSDLKHNIGIQYQVLTESRDGQLNIDDPNRVYHNGEAFRLKIESNINANLYLIAEDARTGERRLLFPNFNYQRGSERVKPFAAITVPPLGQPAFEFDNEPGEERLIVICSRDQIPALELAGNEVTPTSAFKLVAETTMPRDIEQNIKDSDQATARDFIWVKEEPAKKEGNSSVYVVNTSKKDNEEVVYVIRLKHGD